MRTISRIIAITSIVSGTQMAYAATIQCNRMNNARQRLQIELVGGNLKSFQLKNPIFVASGLKPGGQTQFQSMVLEDNHINFPCTINPTDDRVIGCFAKGTFKLISQDSHSISVNTVLSFNLLRHQTEAPVGLQEDRIQLRMLFSPEQHSIPGTFFNPILFEAEDCRAL